MLSFLQKNIVCHLYIDLDYDDDDDNDVDAGEEKNKTLTGGRFCQWWAL